MRILQICVLFVLAISISACGGGGETTRNKTEPEVEVNYGEKLPALKIDVRSSLLGSADLANDGVESCFYETKWAAPVEITGSPDYQIWIQDYITTDIGGVTEVALKLELRTPALGEGDMLDFENVKFNFQFTKEYMKELEEEYPEASAELRDRKKEDFIQYVEAILIGMYSRPVIEKMLFDYINRGK